MGSNGARLQRPRRRKAPGLTGEPDPSNQAALTGLLINRGARRGRQVDALVLEALARHGIRPGPIVRVRRPRGLGRAADTLLAMGVTRLIVGGGDGTLGAVGSRMAHRGATLGVMPLGTANDFARTLAIPGDLDEAARIIARGQVRRVDLGRANDAHFLNVASLGMSAAATSELSPGMKRTLGPFAYLYAGARAFTRCPSFRVRVRNGPDSVETDAHQLVVGNGRFYGGGVLVARQSSLEDGMLHAYALGTQGRWHLLEDDRPAPIRPADRAAGRPLPSDDPARSRDLAPDGRQLRRRDPHQDPGDVLGRTGGLEGVRGLSERHGPPTEEIRCRRTGLAPPNRGASAQASRQPTKSSGCWQRE